MAGILATTVVVGSERFPAVTFVRRLDLGGVTFGVLTSADLAFASLLGVEQVSATAVGAGLEQVVIRSVVPLAERANQFFRLAATLPVVPMETIVASSPVGVMSRGMDRGLSGLAVPLISADHFVGVVAANTATSLAFSAADGSVGSLLAATGKYYVEVVTGPLAGERFDVDTAATIASNDATLTVTLGPGSLSTLPVLTTDALAGARCVLRSHLTLSRLQQMLTPGLVGRNNAALADGVDVLENGRFERYFLRPDGVTWSKAGSTEDFRDKVLPPDNSFMVESKYASQAWRHAGSVRTNPFRMNLVRGLQSFASGFPQDLSPVEIGALVNPAAPAATRWTGNNVFGLADQIHVFIGDPRPWEFFYLRGDGSTWRPLHRHDRRGPLSDSRCDEPGAHPPPQARRGVPHSGAVCARRAWKERIRNRYGAVSLDSREQCASFAAWREWRIGNGHPQPIAFDLYTVPEGFAGHLVGILMKDGGHRQRCSLENVGPGAGDDGIGTPRFSRPPTADWDHRRIAVVAPLPARTCNCSTWA